MNKNKEYNEINKAKFDEIDNFFRLKNGNSQAGKIMFGYMLDYVLNHPDFDLLDWPRDTVREWIKESLKSCNTKNTDYTMDELIGYWTYSDKKKDKVQN